MELEESTCLTSGSTTKPVNKSVVLAQRQKYRSMEQNSPEINPRTYGPLIFDKGGKNIQWIKDLNRSPVTIKFLDKNIGRTLSNINYSKISYDPPSRLLEIKKKINRWDIIKLKSLLTMKETIKHW